jgi:hypothetical protein
VRTDYKIDRPRTGSSPDSTAGRTSLKDLYDRGRRTTDSSRPDLGRGAGAPAPDRGLGSPKMRTSLADRYRDRLDSDIRAHRPATPPSGNTPVAAPRTPGSGPIAEPRSPGSGPIASPRAPDHHPIASPRTPRPGVADRYPTPSTPRDTIARPLTPPGTGLRPIRRVDPIAAPRTPSLGGQRSASNGWSSGYPAGYYYGCSNWSSSYWSLCFGWGYYPGRNWGCYSYPYYWGCYWPRYHYSCGNWFSFGLGWGRFGFSWSWPWSWCGYPYYGYGYPYYYSPGWSYYDDWDYWRYPGTTVVVYDSDPEPPRIVEVVKAGDEIDTSPAASKEKLAQRYVRLGDFYFEEGRYQEASESYLRALTYTPDDGSIHFVLADALFALGDYHYAAFTIGRGLQHDPTLASAEADKRKFYKDVKLFDRQLETLRKYVVDKPYDAAARLVLAYNLKFTGDAAGAKAEFHRVLEIDPNSEPAKLFLAAGEKAESRPAR